MFDEVVKKIWLHICLQTIHQKSILRLLSHVHENRLDSTGETYQTSLYTSEILT